MNALQQDLHETVTGSKINGLGFANIIHQSNYAGQEAAELAAVEIHHRSGIRPIMIIPGIRLELAEAIE